MPFYTVSTNLPSRRPLHALRVIEWLTFVWAVSFTLAHLVIG